MGTTKNETPLFCDPSIKNYDRFNGQKIIFIKRGVFEKVLLWGLQKMKPHFSVTLVSKTMTVLKVKKLFVSSGVFLERYGFGEHIKLIPTFV